MIAHDHKTATRTLPFSQLIVKHRDDDLPRLWVVQQPTPPIAGECYELGMKLGIVYAAFRHGDTVSIGGSYPVSTGTATFTNGDATVTFTSSIAHAFMKDAYIRNSVDTRRYLIKTVTDSTHIEMDAVYAGSTLGGATYYITIPPSTVWYSAVIPTG